MKNNLTKRYFSVLLAAVMIMAMGMTSASACTTLYVGANLNEDGTPYVCRTEDYGSDMNKMWFISEAGHFKEGEKYVGCPEYGAFEWTFTRDSYRFTYFTNDVFHGTCPECGEENPTHWSYTEFGTNEMGVSVSATETISGNAQVKAVDPNVREKKDGIVGIEETDLPTILLAEAATAREGIELLASIYDNYGAYADSGLFVCDQNEVWYIENCSGTQYIALKLNDDLIFTEPNLAIIGEIDLDDTENVIASPRLIEVAQLAESFVGSAEENIIDFRASYANVGTAEAPRVGAPRMVDGLNYLFSGLACTQEALAADNTMFTISNVKDGAIVPVYSNIQVDRMLTKNDIFGFYQLSSVGKPSNQEIEIFQLFKDRPLETATVGWVGVGNMGNNVFVPYYPLLLESIYEGYQVSTETVKRVPKTEEKPDVFCSYAKDRRSGEEYYVAFPENWRNSFYFTFEGLNDYLLYAEQIDGQAVSEENAKMVKSALFDLQQTFISTFEAMEPSLTSEVGADMARSAHELGLQLIDQITAR